MKRVIKHMVRSTRILAACCFLTTSLSVTLDAQESVFSFPSESTDVASIAMGGNISLSPSQPLYSLPTLSLNGIEKWSASYSAVAIPLTKNASGATHSFAGCYRIRRGLDISLGGRVRRSLPVELTSETGNVFGHLTPSEGSVDLAVAMALSRKLSGYIRGSYLMSSVGVTARGVAASVGVAYEDNFRLADDQVVYSTMALSLDNIGPKLSYRGRTSGGSTDVRGKVSLPSALALRAGLHTALTDDHTLGLALSGGYFYHLRPYYGLYGGVGGEYLWRQMISLRIGASVQMRHMIYSAGVGAHYKGLFLQTAYTYSPDMQQRGTLSLGLSYTI